MYIQREGYGVPKRPLYYKTVQSSSHDTLVHTFVHTTHTHTTPADFQLTDGPLVQLTYLTRCTPADFVCTGRDIVQKGT